MATYTLTPSHPDLITGFQNPLMGWHFVAASALDVFGSFSYLVRAGWDYQLFKDQDNPMLQRLSLIKPVGSGSAVVQIVVTDTDWYGLDDYGMVHVLDQDVVTNGYTVAAYTPPPPPVSPHASSSVMPIRVQMESPDVAVN